MNKLLAIFCAAIFCAGAIAQPGDDFLMLKKGNKTIRTYFSGSNIEFISKPGAHISALIRSIKYDTIYMQEFLTRPMATVFGTVVMDTIGSIRHKYCYRDIASFPAKVRKKFNIAGTGSSLISGGMLISLADGVLYLVDRKSFSAPLLVAGLASVGVGLLLSRATGKPIIPGKRGYRLQYIVR